MYFFPATVSIRFINERRQGTVNRSLAGGAHYSEILAAYAITEFGVLILQTLLVYLILQYGFNIGVETTSSPVSALLVLGLCILQGLSGLSFGFFLTLICKQESEAATLIIAIIFPIFFVSGVLWPVEGMPYILQNLSPIFPMTLPTQALRSIMNRGWGVLHSQVWGGYFVSLAYIVGFSFFTYLRLKRNTM